MFFVVLFCQLLVFSKKDMFFQFYLENIIEIAPALIGFGITGLALLYFLFFSKCQRQQHQIVLLSFSFIGSGFIFQIFITNFEKIKDVIKNINIILNVPILTTALGIFLANRFLKFFTDREQKKEVSILLKHAIELQLKFLEKIDLYTPGTHKKPKDDIKESIEIIDIYLTKLKAINQSYYKTAFDKIGAYKSSLAVDSISRYSLQLESYLAIFEKYFSEIKRWDELEKDKNFYYKTYLELKTNLLIVKLLGFLLLYLLKLKYIQEEPCKLTNTFYNNCNQAIEEIKNIWKFSYFFITTNIWAKSFFDELIFFQDQRRRAAGKNKWNNEAPIYFCAIFSNADIFVMENMLEKSCPEYKNYRRITFLASNEAFVAFANSEDDSIKQGKKLLSDTFKERFEDAKNPKIKVAATKANDESDIEKQVNKYVENKNFDELVEYLDFEIKTVIISPWD